MITKMQTEKGHRACGVTLEQLRCVKTKLRLYSEDSASETSVLQETAERCP